METQVQLSPPDPPSVVVGGGISLRVLIIDDDTSILDSMKRLLELDGHTVVCVTNLNAAIEAARFDFDVVLTDWDLGLYDRHNGAQICDSLRFYLPNAKFIIMSGLDRQVAANITFCSKDDFSKIIQEVES